MALNLIYMACRCPQDFDCLCSGSASHYITVYCTSRAPSTAMCNLKIPAMLYKAESLHLNLYHNLFAQSDVSAWWALAKESVSEQSFQYYLVWSCNKPMFVRGMQCEAVFMYLILTSSCTCTHMHMHAHTHTSMHRTQKMGFKKCNLRDTVI